MGVFRSSRGKGVGLALMEAAHRRLQSEGYSGCILCPADEALFRYYEKLGYTLCGDFLPPDQDARALMYRK